MLFRAIIYLVVNILSLLLVKNLVTNFQVDNLTAAATFVVIMTLVNWVIMPVIKLFTLPITILTLGISNLIINFAAIWLIAGYVEGVSINGSIRDQAITVIILSVVLSLASGIAESLTKKDD